MPTVKPMALALLLVLVPVSLTPTLTPLVTYVTPPVGGGGVPFFNGTLVNGTVLGTHYSARFYEYVLSDSLTTTKSLVKIGAFLNTTPGGMIRFGGVGEGYNPTTQINYLPPSSGSGTFVPTSQQLWNLTWFKSWCLSKTPDCGWLGYLPGEENDTAAAVHFAKWYHSVYGLAPTYWEFGNEPSQWKHFGKNFSTWSTIDALQPTAIGYATMVHNYIQAVKKVFPADKFIGLEAACACNRQLAALTAKVDGSLVSGLAYHSYPSSSTSSTQLSSFYSLLTSNANISSSAARFRAGVTLNCPTCTSVPVELGEYQAGPFSTFSPYAAQYPGAPWLASSLIQGMQANLTTVAVYNADSLYNVSSNNISFEGHLYQQVLSNLTMGTDYGVTIKGSGVGGLFSVLIKNGTREALLVVNTNLTKGLTLTVGSTLFPVGLLGSKWTWNPGALLPTFASLLKIPKLYSVPPQGILLVTNY